jgi:Uma2 family endonuclease
VPELGGDFMADPTVLESLPSFSLSDGLDDSLYEIVNGERLEKAPMSAYALTIAFLLAIKIYDFAKSQRLGRAGVEVLFLLDPQKTIQRRPDAYFVSFQRWPEDKNIPHSDPWQVVPDLAVEVISKTNQAEAILEKLEEYFQSGVSLVWVVYPSRKQIYVYTSPTQVQIVSATEELDGGTVLPDFRVPLSILFGKV